MHSRHHCRTIFGSLFLAAAIQLTAVGPLMAGPTGGTYDDSGHKVSVGGIAHKPSRRS